MIIAAPVNECDFTGRKYAEPVMGGHCLAAGATGRVCVVMYVGPEYLAETGWVTRPEAEVRAALVAKGTPEAFLDF